METNTKYTNIRAYRTADPTSYTPQAPQQVAMQEMAPPQQPHQMELNAVRYTANQQCVSLILRFTTDRQN